MSNDNLELMQYLESYVADKTIPHVGMQEQPDSKDLPKFFQPQYSKQPELNEKLNQKIQIINKIDSLLTSGDTENIRNFFIGFYEDHRALNIAYGVALYRIKLDLEELDRLKTSQDTGIKVASKEINNLKEKISLSIADRMIVAKLLSVILPRATNRYISELKNLGQKLYDICDYDCYLENRLDKDFLHKSYIEKNEISDFIGFAKNNVVTVENNLWRLFVIRLRRVMLLLTALLTRFKEYLSAVNILENNGVRIIFIYIVPLWFIPRLIFNTYLTAAAFYGTRDYSSLELMFSPLTRVSAALSPMGWEIINDIMWVSSGILGCVLAFGAYAFVLPYIAIVAQAYDFITSCFRYYFDTQRLDKMIKIYNKNKSSSTDESAAIEDLKYRLEVDRKILIYSMINFFVLMSMTVLLLPVFGTISPIIPLIAGIVAVLVTIWHFNNTRVFNEQRRSLYENNLISIDDRCVLVCNEKQLAVSKNEKGELDAMKLQLGCHTKGFLRVIKENPNDGKLYYIDIQDKENPMKEIQLNNPQEVLNRFDNKEGIKKYLPDWDINKVTNTRAKTLSAADYNSLCEQFQLKTIDGVDVKKSSVAKNIKLNTVSGLRFA